MSKTFLYFAYGSDMSLPQMRGRLLEAELVLEDDARSSAKLSGFRLVFDRAVPQHAEVGHANLQAADGAVTEGVLYELPERALSVLDVAEGVGQGFSSRLEVDVETSKGTCKAYAYVAAPDWVKADLIPSRNHLYRLLSAQRYLSPEYFASLKAVESKKVPVDDEGMPHSVRKQVRRQAEEMKVEPEVEPKPEKKKFYPAVGSYAPKSANAARKAYGDKKAPERSAPRSDRPASGAGKPEARSPWAGRSADSRSDSRSDFRGDSRGAGRGDSRNDSRGASRSEKPASPWGQKKPAPRKPGGGRPW